MSTDTRGKGATSPRQCSTNEDVRKETINHNRHLSTIDTKDVIGSSGTMRDEPLFCRCIYYLLQLIYLIQNVEHDDCAFERDWEQCCYFLDSKHPKFSYFIRNPNQEQLLLQLLGISFRHWTFRLASGLAFVASIVSKTTDTPKKSKWRKYYFDFVSK